MEPDTTKPLSKEEEFLLSRQKEILSSQETHNQYLDFLLEKLPTQISKNLDDNIDLLQAMERRIDQRLTKNNISPNVAKVGMYLKIICCLGIKDPNVKEVIS